MNPKIFLIKPNKPCRYIWD